MYVQHTFSVFVVCVVSARTVFLVVFVVCISGVMRSVIAVCLQLMSTTCVQYAYFAVLAVCVGVVCEQYISTACYRCVNNVGGWGGGGGWVGAWVGWCV